MRAGLAIGLALIVIGYVVIQFGVLVLDDVAADREAGEDDHTDAETVAWLEELMAPAPTREPFYIAPTGDGGMDDLILEALMPPPRFGQQRTPGGAP